MTRWFEWFFNWRRLCFKTAMSGTKCTWFWNYDFIFIWLQVGLLSLFYRSHRPCCQSWPSYGCPCFCYKPWPPAGRTDIRRTLISVIVRSFLSVCKSYLINRKICTGGHNSDFDYSTVYFFCLQSQHVEDYADAIDDKPRSRKPIAYSMDELNLDQYPEQSPYIESGPPAYHTHDPYMNSRDYMTTPSQNSYNANYGAPC